GPNSEVRAQICGLRDLLLHARRSSSSAIASSISPTSPRRARLQLNRHRKGTITKTKKQRDRRTAEIIWVVLDYFLVQWALQPIGTVGPARGTRYGGDDKAR
ncbi:unnamed protein product, partial [Prunus brigantina]